MKNNIKCSANKHVSILKYGLLLIAFMFCCFSKSNAQAEGQYDTLNIGTIDTTSLNGFVSHYEAVEIATLDETVIDLNTVLEVQELLIGTKYTATISYTNTFNYDLVFNTDIKKPTSSCSCLKLNYTNTILPSGDALTMQIDIFPFVSGNKYTLIELPILKKSPVEGNPPTVVAIKPIKLNFKVK